MKTLSWLIFALMEPSIFDFQSFRLSCYDVYYNMEHDETNALTLKVPNQLVTLNHLRADLNS